MVEVANAVPLKIVQPWSVPHVLNEDTCRTLCGEPIAAHVEVSEVAEMPRDLCGGCRYETLRRARKAVGG